MEKKQTKKAAPKTASAKPATTRVKKEKTKKTVAESLAHGVGRRKSAVARVWLKKGTGLIVVNGKELDAYFDTSINRMEASTPFRIVPTTNMLDIEANVIGGGMSAQAGAVKLGIARALLGADETLRPVLRGNGLLTVDSRVKERKKYGQKAARRKFQFVKR